MERLIKLSGTEETFGGVRDLLVKEQFMESCPDDLSTYLKQQKLHSIDKIAVSADSYLKARNLQLKGGTIFSKRNTAKQSDSTVVCFKCNKVGHRAAECRSSNSEQKCVICKKKGHMARECPEKRVEKRAGQYKAASAVAVRAKTANVSDIRSTKDTSLVEIAESRAHNGKTQLAT